MSTYCSHHTEPLHRGVLPGEGSPYWYCSALIMAAVEMRQGDSQSLNNWLRVRVITQGASIDAVCVGTYAKNSNVSDETKQTRRIDEIQAHREGRERKEDRLKKCGKVVEETQDAVSGRDLNVLNTIIAKGVSPAVEDQTPQHSSQSDLSWWKYVRWSRNGSSASSNPSSGGNNKPS